MASRTVTSEIAMVPDSEFSEPTLTVEPEVSTQDSALAPSVSLALLPHPDSTRPAVRRTPVVARADFLSVERRGGRMENLSSCSVARSDRWISVTRRSEGTVAVSNRDVRAPVFL
jgi:hypothetical protein